MNPELQLLPDDILFKVFSFLSPLEMLRFRQVARRMHALSLERTVWTTAYRVSTLFIPPVAVSSQTVHDLERHLVHASRLDANWNGPNLMIERQRRLACHIAKQGIRGIELYRGRYLLLGSRSSFSLFDLDKAHDWDQPIFQMAETGDTYVFCGLGPSRGDTYTCEEVYIPMLRRQRSTEQDTLIIWKLCPTEEVPMVEVTSLPVTPSSQIQTWLANSLLVFKFDRSTENQSSSAMVYNIATRKRYQFPEPEEGSPWRSRAYHTEYIPTLDYVFAMHISLQETTIQVFSYPHSDEDTLIQTHFGVCPRGFLEPALIASYAGTDDDADAGISLTLCLAAVFHQTGLQPFRLQLHRDGTLSFDLPPPVGIPAAYSLMVTANQLGRARGVSLTANSSVTLLLHEIEFHNDHESRSRMEIRSKSMIVSDLAYGNNYTFDGFRGRLCVPSDTTVEIYDFV
ncbi:hypothetical protein WG66_000501 [Moniliophthora roreri]|uniref:F-box domain-containing protein n=1 Tax=Moniliophthora roreri TaxID=221103 RepID=A0A0W0FW14_MONRR|nr:hypothetical protein WG66_000501 [Moniliophthora roreri]